MRELKRLLLSALLSMSVASTAYSQHDANASFSAIQSRLEQQEQEIARLRAQLESLDPHRPEVVSNVNHFQAATPSDIEERLAAIEQELQKAADASAKEKEEDAAKPAIKPRMRLQMDSGWFDQSPANRALLGDIQDGIYFRRARLGFDASAFDVTEYRLDFEMGSGGGRPSLFDAYLRITDLAYLQNVQVGRFREPFSLDAQTSTNWMTFIERAPNNVFDPSRNWGVMTSGNTEMQDATWAIGVFRDGSDDFGDDIGDTGGRAVTSRLTWLPWYDESSDGRYYFHVGASGSYRDPDKADPGGAETSILGYAVRPEVNINEDAVGGVPPFINTGTLADVNDYQLGGIESVLVLGSLSIQGEYIGAYVDRAANPNPWFHGAYIEASYFLTGEFRPYNRRAGTFAQTDVFEPFFRVWTDSGIGTGSGAWEIAARWSYVDLNDGGVNGGYLDDTNLGVNWYLNPYARFMFNYIHADLHHPVQGRSDADVFLTRVSVFF